MQIKYLLDEIEKLGVAFYTGVPDSQLRALCDTLMSRYGIGEKHVIAANEGAAVGLAAGHYLATGNPAVVYMQNSGIGNAINPICSLVNDKVYAIPVLFIVGWRGEPGVHDEPQHIYQGEITRELLDCLGVQNYVISKDTSPEELAGYFSKIKEEFALGHQCALVVRKGALESDEKLKYANDYPLSREDVVKLFVDHTDERDIIVSTTGKLSRELFEAREARGQGHEKDFLTVGSMGHSSMIAMGIAREKKERRVFCLDGDGAVLMHMGSLAVAGSAQLENFVHVLFNNGAHETVGGMPTVSEKIDYLEIAKACGYDNIYTAKTEEEVISLLEKIANAKGSVFAEVKTNLVSRADLGRPTTTPIQNKEAFMEFLK
jgi:phosphonopyruvate decarboxylase